MGKQTFETLRSFLYYVALLCPLFESPLYSWNMNTNRTLGISPSLRATRTRTPKLENTMMATPSRNLALKAILKRLQRDDKDN